MLAIGKYAIYEWAGFRPNSIRPSRQSGSALSLRPTDCAGMHWVIAAAGKAVDIIHSADCSESREHWIAARKSMREAR